MDKRERGRQSESDKRGISDKRNAVLEGRAEIINGVNDSIILSGKREKGEERIVIHVSHKKIKEFVRNEVRTTNFNVSRNSMLVR